MGKKNVFEGLGGFFESVANLADKISELSEKESTSNSGVFESNNGKVKGSYGFNIRFGPDSPLETPVTESSQHPEKRKTAPVRETREPLVDVIKEEDFVSVIIEMPGLELEDAWFELNRDVLIIKGEKGQKKYYREMLLPGTYSTESMEVSCNNGVFEVRCR